MKNVNPTIKWRKTVASCEVDGVLYISVPFTWLLREAKELADAWRPSRGTARVVVGGPGAILMRGLIDWASVGEDPPVDFLGMFNPEATFTTRGCPNGCAFCAVPLIEGHFRELEMWRPGRIICDNNLLAASRKHFERVVDSLAQFRGADFNQGLDASLFTPWHAGQVARLRQPMVRFSFDHVDDEAAVADAIVVARRAGLKRFGVYVLFGFRDSLEDARYRLEKVRSWGIRPTPMRYQPLDAEEKNAYVAPGWTERELLDVQRYYSNLRFFEHIPFEEYDYRIGH